MYLRLSDNHLFIISALLLGLSIKLFDDFVDENKTVNIPYIMCFLGISIFLYRENLGLFLSAYIIGMFHDRNITLIIGLKAYQEQIIVIILLVIIAGVKSSVFSLLIIFAIQLIDDLIDERYDASTGKKNWAAIFGRVEVSVALIILIIISLYIDRFKALTCSLISIAISALSGIKSTKLKIQE
ncbi:hypothetical protein OXPF_13170 [Oxobacter pfennigii]|uniref:Uncharacterized protein n=1 Tax=Oxobacter pfennigii TaxID=36849 RepID=A0A0P9AHA3_9CLOT|nr:hypothetical protein [Oxobacter pfennigii]KPU44842.1 hypothetical protein OXPF_13170 [Oxobacter pfennigii]